MTSGKISVSTPIAKGLLGKEVGDVAEIKVPSGVMKFEIIDISIYILNIWPVTRFNMGVGYSCYIITSQLVKYYTCNHTVYQRLKYLLKKYIIFHIYYQPEIIKLIGTSHVERTLQNIMHVSI